MAFEKLLSPIKLGNVTIKNRVVMAPMGVGFAPGENKINDAYVKYFEARRAYFFKLCGLFLFFGNMVS